jgi:hypothetical protein
MSRRVNRVLRLMNCLEWVEDELRRSEPGAQDWVRATLEPARRAAGTAFEALRSAARRGDSKAKADLDALVASLRITDAQRSLVRAPDAALHSKEPIFRREERTASLAARLGGDRVLGHETQ